MTEIKYLRPELLEAIARNTLTMVRQVNEEKRELMIPDIATNQ